VNRARRLAMAAVPAGLLLALGASASATALPLPGGPPPARSELSFAALSSVHGANHFLLRRAGANLQLLDTDTGALLRNVSVARTARVSISGANGRVDNTLTLDFSGGSLAVPGGISYSGGRGGYNVLAVRGGRFAAEREIAHTAHSGVMLLGDTTVRYAEIAPINDTAAATNFTVSGTVAGETINVVNGPVLAGVQTTQVNSGGGTFELVNFAHKTNVTVDGVAGNDTFNLNSATASVGLSSLTVDSGERESSTFNVLAIPVGVSLVGAGTDTANIGTGSAESISSPIAISDPKEFIAVNVNDSAGVSSRFVTLNSGDTISGLTQSTVTMQSGDLSSIAISGSSAGNTFVLSGAAGPAGRMLPITLNTGTGTDSAFVQSVAAGSSIAIHGQNGNDGVAISNAGTVQGILGPVSIDNTIGFTGVVLDDSNDPTGRVATLASAAGSDTISGIAPAIVTAHAGDLGTFTLDGGSGGNTLTLSGLAAAGAVTLNTGTGSDTTNVQPTSPLGALNVNGQTGADTVDLGSAGSVQGLTGAVNVTNAAATALTINDALDTTSRAVIVGTTQLTGLAPAAINYSDLSALKIEGGGPSDTFAVNPSATTTEDILGGGPASPAAPGNTLAMNLTGLSSPALNGTPSAAGAQGTWTFANRSPVTFSHMQSLNPTALSVGDATTTVGGSGSSPLLFPVGLLAATTQPVSATYATADGSATAAAGAYQPASGTILFPPGATSETVRVDALGSPTVRAPQTLVLALVEPVNALLARSLATGTITDGFSPAPLPGAAHALLAPSLTHLTQTRTSWRVGKARAVITSRARRTPVGTSFAFSLDQAARVALAFNRSSLGRKAGGRCVVQTKKNRTGRACRRIVAQGTLAIAGHAGINRISFQGRLASGTTLKPARYTLVVAATNAAGQHSPPSALTFTIVK
jgi:Calx-beta domain-containing protein